MFQSKILSEKELVQYTEELAQMRLDYFREFPYLYEGKIQDEINYIKTYLEIEQAVIVAALTQEGQLIGFASAQPLEKTSHFTQNLTKKFHAKHLDINQFYYLAETIIKKPYQSKGIGKILLAKEKECAKQFGFSNTCFMAVERHENHPLRPDNYENIDSMFESLGYYKTNIYIELAWPTLQADGALKDQKNQLHFWFEK